jgi:hypothetical protein
MMVSDNKCDQWVRTMKRISDLLCEVVSNNDETIFELVPANVLFVCSY